MQNAYDQDLRPALRYSFLLLLHITFETQLRIFCDDLRSERPLPKIRLTDLRGSPVEQAQTFLTNLAGIGVQDFPEWEHRRTLQKLRDCIVHAYGRVEGSRDKEFLRRLAAKGIGVSIDHEDRLALAKAFSEQQLANLRGLFEHLFTSVDWQRKVRKNGVSH